MGRKRLKIEGNTISGSAEDIIDALDQATNSFKEKEVKIKSASLKDEFCNYTYEHRMGATAGDECKRDGACIVHNDLKASFSRLNVHLAFIDDAFINAGHHVNDIEEWNDSEITEKYTVVGFKLGGGGENECVFIHGYKVVKEGVIDFNSPKIYFTGSYPFIQELRVVVDDCIEEVYQYLHGKAAPKLVQQEMEFENKSAETE